MPARDEPGEMPSEATGELWREASRSAHTLIDLWTHDPMEAAKGGLPPDATRLQIMRHAAARTIPSCFRWEVKPLMGQHYALVMTGYTSPETGDADASDL